MKYLNRVVLNQNPVISALAYWGSRTRLSTTGRNVANLKEEFKVDPFNCSPEDISVMKREIPEYGNENMELLVRLFESKDAEMDPDVVSELTTLIDNICEQ